MIATRSIIVSLVPLLLACASAPSTESRRGSGDADVITEAELATFGGQPVRNAIDKLRPQFLRTRGRSSITRAAEEGIVVYLGSMRMGRVEVLSQVPSSDLSSVRYLSAADASRRFGLDHTTGAIILSPKK